MKKLLLIALLITIVSNAQIEKYKASDYSLSNDVKNYNAFTYKYDVELGKYKTVEKHILIFENGLLKIDYILDNYLGRFSQIKSYEYNDKKQLISIKKAEDYEKPQYYLFKEFFYEKNNLVKETTYSGYDKFLTDVQELQVLPGEGRKIFNQHSFADLLYYYLYSCCGSLNNTSLCNKFNLIQVIK